MHTQKITNVSRTGTWQKLSEESRSELFVQLVGLQYRRVVTWYSCIKKKKFTQKKDSLTNLFVLI